MTIINQGFVTSKSDYRQYAYEMSLLDISQSAQIMACQSYDLSIEDSEHYAPLSSAEIGHIMTNGLVVGVFVLNHLIGFHAAYFPGDSIDNLGRDIGLTTKQQKNVYHLEAVYIIPEYRGNGLQMKMAFTLIQLIKNLGSYRYLCETVSPYNVTSLENIFAVNAFIVKLAYKYGHQLRYIFYQDTLQPLVIDEATSITVPILDHQKQMALLAAGYLGYHLIKNMNDSFVLYAKLKEKT